jgi:hypothetical protein
MTKDQNDTRTKIRRKMMRKDMRVPPAQRDGTSRRKTLRFVASTLRARLDDVLVGDGALLRRDEGNGCVLLGDVLLLS